MQKEIDGFEIFKLNKQIQNAVAEKGFKQPTPIQQKAIPQILAGQEVIGIAQTGTGKTAAYLLPLIKMLSHAQGIQPRALIIVPTRELAAQVAASFRDFAKYTDLRFGVAIGATGAKKQIEEIEKGIDVIIATPGRLLDLYSGGYLVLKKVEYFILDEAERLMDISFINQLYSLLEVLPRKRKHYLFSATMSELVKKIAGDFIEFPQIIHIEPNQKIASGVTQEVFLVPNFKTKINLLRYFLKHAEFSKLIVFCKSKAIANNVYKYISETLGSGFVQLVHGNKTQQSRINAVSQFAATDARMLVTTDVAARGIDIANVSHVINFDLPIIYEDYIHRIGRTGRALQTGHAISFVNDADVYHLKKIEKLIKQTIPVSEIPPTVFVEKTGFEEQQLMAREIDFQKRKENPEFTGAFHQKKNSNKSNQASRSNKKSNFFRNKSK